MPAELGLGLALAILGRPAVRPAWESRDCLPQTYRFQILLQDVPRRLHHFKHHVVLDVLHKVEHSLAQSKSASKPERAK